MNHVVVPSSLKISFVIHMSKRAVSIIKVTMVLHDPLCRYEAWHDFFYVKVYKSPFLSMYFKNII